MVKGAFSSKSQQTLIKQVLLVLDNESLHFLEDMHLFEQNFTVLYLLSNFIALIQHMVQNVILNKKVTTRKKLLFHVFWQQEVDPEVFKKKNSMKDMFSLTHSWQQLSSKLIRNSWKPLWPSLFEPEDTWGQDMDDFNPEDNLPLKCKVLQLCLP